MASPHVAGEAALVWTTDYNTSNLAVVNRIFQTANKNVLAGSTYGRIDAYASVASGTPSPSPVPQSCTAPSITAHSDTNPTRGGTVSFAWNAVVGASQYRVQRQNRNGTWSTRTTTSATTYTGSDASNDPFWQVFVFSGSCTPIPGPATLFNP